MKVFDEFMKKWDLASLKQKTNWYLNISRLFGRTCKKVGFATILNKNRNDYLLEYHIILMTIEYHFQTD